MTLSGIWDEQRDLKTEPWNTFAKSCFRALEEPYQLCDGELLTRQRAFESNARAYPRKIPLALKRGWGIYLEDVEGRTFVDCLACAGALALGHHHAEIQEAIERFLRSGTPFQTLDLTTPLKDEFVQELLGIFPTPFSRAAKVQFCGPTGTDAVEAAIKLAKIATGRSGILAFQGAYHGMTLGALGLMGNVAPKSFVGPLSAGVQFLPFPYSYRCPFGLGREAGEQAGLAYISSVLRDPESGVPKPAAVIVEVVQGEGGAIPASDAWLQELRRITSEAGVLLIVDEVQTGLARTGSLLAFQRSGITPDIVVMSKAIGGGLPLSVVVYDQTLDTWGPGAHAGTFRGNQMAMAAGLATMKFVRRHRLDKHAWQAGERFTGQLAQLQEECPFVGDVRGRGLMIGMEIVEPGHDSDVACPPPTSPVLARLLQEACLRRGLIVELGGRDGATMRFLPPLVISEEELDHVFRVVRTACEDVAKAS